MRYQEIFDELCTVKLSSDGHAVDILDQTLLPGEIKRIQLRTPGEVYEAIKKLRVRGAPALGICGAYALAVTASLIEADSFGDFYSGLKKIAEYIASSRPTAVNLAWALERILRTAEKNRTRDIPSIIDTMFSEADRIREEDISISRRIGSSGAELIREVSEKKGDAPVGILTHCNAGTLATGMYGTALAPVYMALSDGFSRERMHVYCDETRPLLQGARLTALELSKVGVRTTLQCDNMAASLMKKGCIDMIFVGADRISANGDTANKIGTLGLAVMAKHFGISFFVCAPGSTVDLSKMDGNGIPIEDREASEVTSMWYEKPMAPSGIEVYNPAFDVTDHELISAIITERGIIREPFTENLRV